MHWQYVIPGYLIVFVGLAVYAALLLSGSGPLPRGSRRETAVP